MSALKEQNGAGCAGSSSPRVGRSIMSKTTNWLSPEERERAARLLLARRAVSLLPAIAARMLASECDRGIYPRCRLVRRRLGDR